MSGNTFPAADHILLPILCVLLVVAVALVFGQTSGFAFVNYDDDTDVYENRLVTGTWTADSFRAVFTAHGEQRTTPLTILSHRLVWQLFGPRAAAHHLANVVLHAAAAVALLGVLWRMTGRPWPSAVVAALFAVHPLRAESVAWVTERKDVLGGLLFLLTLAAYVEYARRRFALGRYLVVLACLALSLAAKPMAVTLPFVLLLLDYWPLRRMHGGEPHRPDQPSILGRLILEKLPLLALVGLVCIGNILARPAEAFLSNRQYSWVWRIGNALVSYAAYLVEFVWPVGLGPRYPRRDVLPAWEVAAAAVLLIGITALAVRWRGQRPYVLVGWLWYVGMLVPVIGLVQFGGESAADRFTYLPQIGVALALAWAAADAWDAWPRVRPLVALGVACGVAALAVAAWHQTSFWRDSFTLWTRAVACNPHNAAAHNNLGAALADRGQIDAAIAHYTQAVAFEPDYAEAQANLGNALARRGRSDEAEACYERALQGKPKLAWAHAGLGDVLSDLGRDAEADRHFQQALQLDPNCAEAHNHFGAALARRDRPDEAAAEFRRAIALKPGFADAHENLGLTLRGQNRLDEAAAEFRAALALNPGLAEAYGNLGGVLYLQGKPDAALVQFQKHMELDPSSDMARRNFALAVGQLRGPPAALVHWRWWIDFHAADAGLIAAAAWQLSAGADATLRNGKEAVELAQRAVRLTAAQEPAALATLTTAYAEAGCFPEAVATARRAAELATRQNNAAMTKFIRAQLALYEAGKPYHEPPRK